MFKNLKSKDVASMKFFRIIDGNTLAMILPENAKGLNLVLQTVQEFKTALENCEKYDKESLVQYCCTKEVFSTICKSYSLYIYDFESSQKESVTIEEILKEASNLLSDDNQECRDCSLVCAGRKKNQTFLEAGKYYQIENGIDEPDLVYSYMYEGEKMIGFNCAAGGNMVAVKDLTPETKTYEVKITKV